MSDWDHENKVTLDSSIGARGEKGIYIYLVTS